MADIVKFADQLQEVSRSVFAAIGGLAETQVNLAQRLGAVQQDVISQIAEATKDQLQVISKVRDPREFASAQAELVKTHGQRYVDSLKQVIDATVKAWQDYGSHLEAKTHDITNKAERPASAKKAA